MYDDFDLLLHNMDAFLDEVDEHQGIGIMVQDLLVDEVDEVDEVEV